jgi:hypothetical protein
MTAMTTSRLQKQIRVQNVWGRAHGFTEVAIYGFEFILQLNGDLNRERTPCLRQAARRNRDEKPSNLNLT